MSGNAKGELENQIQNKIKQKFFDHQDTKTLSFFFVPWCLRGKIWLKLIHVAILMEKL